MLDSPNTNVRENTNTTADNDGDEQYLPIYTKYIPMLYNPNPNDQENKNTATPNGDEHCI